MTAPESLDWVTFSDEEDGSCDGRSRIPCGQQAVAVVVWKAVCGCGPNPQRVCAAHRDSFAADLRATGQGFHCAACRELLWLLRIEPIR